MDPACSALLSQVHSLVQRKTGDISGRSVTEALFGPQARPSALQSLALLAQHIADHNSKYHTTVIIDTIECLFVALPETKDSLSLRRKLEQSLILLLNLVLGGRENWAVAKTAVAGVGTFLAALPSPLLLPLQLYIKLIYTATRPSKGAELSSEETPPQAPQIDPVFAFLVEWLQGSPLEELMLLRLLPELGKFSTGPAEDIMVERFFGAVLDRALPTMVVAEEETEAVLLGAVIPGLFASAEAHESDSPRLESWLKCIASAIESIVSSPYAVQLTGTLYQLLESHFSWHTIWLDVVAKGGPLGLGGALAVGQILALHQASPWICQEVTNIFELRPEAINTLVRAVDFFFHSKQALFPALLTLCQQWWLSYYDFLSTAASSLVQKILSLDPNQAEQVSALISTALSKKEGLQIPCLGRASSDLLALGLPTSLQAHLLLLFKQAIQNPADSPGGTAVSLTGPILSLLAHTDSFKEIAATLQHTIEDGASEDGSRQAVGIWSILEALRLRPDTQPPPAHKKALLDLYHSALSNPNTKSVAFMALQRVMAAGEGLGSEFPLEDFAKATAVQLEPLIRDTPFPPKLLQLLPVSIASLRLKTGDNQRAASIVTNLSLAFHALPHDPAFLLSLASLASVVPDAHLNLLATLRGAYIACATAAPSANSLAPLCFLFARDFICGQGGLSSGVQAKVPGATIGAALLNISSPFLNSNEVLSGLVSFGAVVEVLKVLEASHRSPALVPTFPLTSNTLLRLLSLASFWVKSGGLRDPQSSQSELLEVLIQLFASLAALPPNCGALESLEVKPKGGNKASGLALAKSSVLSVLAELLSLPSVISSLKFSDDVVAHLHDTLPTRLIPFLVVTAPSITATVTTTETTTRTTSKRRPRSVMEDEEGEERAVTSLPTLRQPGAMSAMKRRKVTPTNDEDDDAIDSIDVFSTSALRGSKKAPPDVGPLARPPKRPLPPTLASDSPPKITASGSSATNATATTSEVVGPNVDGREAKQLFLRLAILILNNSASDLTNGTPLHQLLNAIQCLTPCCNLATECEEFAPTVRLVGAHLLRMLADNSITHKQVIKAVVEFCLANWPVAKDRTDLAFALVDSLIPPTTPLTAPPPSADLDVTQLALSMWTGLKQSAPAKLSAAGSAVAFLASLVPEDQVPLSRIIELLSRALLKEMAAAKNLSGTSLQTSLGKLAVLTTKKIRAAFLAQKTSQDDNGEDPPNEPTGEGDVDSTMSWLRFALELSRGILHFNAQPKSKVPFFLASRSMKAACLALLRAIASVGRSRLKRPSGLWEALVETPNFRETWEEVQGVWEEFRESKPARPSRRKATTAAVSDEDLEDGDGGSSDEEMRALIDEDHEEGEDDIEDLGGESEEEADARLDARRSRKSRIRSANSFIDAALRDEPGDDDYADLEDFIVFKKGKKYDF